jgi:hypothetical protein
MNKHTRPDEWDQGPKISVGPPGEPPPPGTTSAFRFDCEEAKESEDYHGIYRDLEFVINVTRQLRTVLLQESDQASDEASPTSVSDDVLRALWISALVTYGRCFHKGKRRWLDERIFEGEAEDVLTLHRYFRDYRDKHTAHSVNPFEIHATGIKIAGRDGDDPHVEGVVTMFATRGNETPEVVGYLEWLATYAQNVAGKKHKEASNKVLERAESLTKEQLKKLRPLEVMPQQGFEAARSRRR